MFNIRRKTISVDMHCIASIVRRPLDAQVICDECDTCMWVWWCEQNARSACNANRITHCLWSALSSYENKILPVAARFPFQMTSTTHAQRLHAVSLSLSAMAFIGSICIRLLRSHSPYPMIYPNIMLSTRYIIHSMDAKIIPVFCV